MAGSAFFTWVIVMDRPTLGRQAPSSWRRSRNNTPLRGTSPSREIAPADINRCESNSTRMEFRLQAAWRYQTPKTPPRPKPPEGGTPYCHAKVDSLRFRGHRTCGGARHGMEFSHANCSRTDESRL